ncbi:hypothetical protein BJ508DRAFT_415348 [Ascobolus immersus RN42]|uniref:NADH-cytochrome b5 reductase 1 n=1 Tax=Ascobolus immersus RN42 TaxID=1160509 RepID=A0A3N4I8T5_ASCIM|nr:hypothetical protein BJ508DRAFT_415348 [Ascobolus immersus RN42]
MDIRGLVQAGAYNNRRDRQLTIFWKRSNFRISISSHYHEYEPMAFTLEEVARHNTKDDLWLVIHNKVYNISKYLEDHPGGVDVLIELAGQDATTAFEDIGHSDEAREQMEPFFVGELADEHKQEEVVVYRPKFEAVKAGPILKQKKSTKVAELGGAALLIGPAAYMFRHHLGLPTNFSLDILNKLPSLPSSSSKSGFWLGFASAAAITTVLTAIAGHYISEALEVNTPLSAYPPRKRPTYTIYTHHKPALNRTLPPALDPKEYRKFPLVQREQLTHNTFRFVFALPNPKQILGLPIGQHVAIRAEIDGKMVTRSYTPVSNDTDMGRMELVIKVYEGGLITNYLKNLKIGDLVEFRGPKGAMRYHRDLAKHIGMIAGGTGITPMFQLIRAICEDDADTTTVSLLYANVSEEDILIREQLEAWQARCPQKLKVYYVVNHAPENWQYGTGFITKDLIAERLPPVHPENKIMLCGPPGMVNAMKKNLGELGFTVPGAVAKATDQIFCF